MNEHKSETPVVLVSGASSGIGEAICRLLVAQQFRVVAAARNQDRLEQLAAQLGDALYPLVLDVTDSAAVSKLPQALPGEFDRRHAGARFRPYCQHGFDRGPQTLCHRSGLCQ